MSLNMYLGETDSQTNTMNKLCVHIIQSMEQVMDSIDSFTGATLLQGKTYKSAKIYMSATFRPLAQGMIDLCEELIRQNNKYPSDFQSQVATTDVIEQEVKMQISKLEDLIEKYETINDTVPLFDASLSIYYQMKRQLERKLEHLFEFNATSSSNYDTAIHLADLVMNGLNEIQKNNGFNKKDGTFSTGSMNLDWQSKLGEAHYNRKAKEEYGDYFEENEDGMDRL